MSIHDLIRRKTLSNVAPDGSAAACVEAVLQLHRPHRIFDECGHHHDYNEDGSVPDGVIDMGKYGLVCDEGLVDTVCSHCCAGDGYGQTEECASAHGVEFHQPACSTVVAIGKSLGIEALT